MATNKQSAGNALIEKLLSWLYVLDWTSDHDPFAYYSQRIAALELEVERLKKDRDKTT